MEEVVKLVTKARKWNVLKFEEVPSRRTDPKNWKAIITDEFTSRTNKTGNDIAYSLWKKHGAILEQLGNAYAIRQPLSDGTNFINYIISYIEIYKQLFNSQTKSEIDFYDKFTQNIINIIDGTIDLKALYQLSLLCYISKWGSKKLIEASLLIFRFVYSLRVSQETRVTEKTVINHNKSMKLIDYILLLNNEKELLDWLRSYTVIPNNRNIGGVKSRFINRVECFFSFKTKQDFSDYDTQLLAKMKQIILQKNE